MPSKSKPCSSGSEMKGSRRLRLFRLRSRSFRSFRLRLRSFRLRSVRRGRGLHGRCDLGLLCCPCFRWTVRCLGIPCGAGRGVRACFRPGDVPRHACHPLWTLCRRRSWILGSVCPCLVAAFVLVAAWLPRTRTRGLLFFGRFGAFVVRFGCFCAPFGGGFLVGLVCRLGRLSVQNAVHQVLFFQFVEPGDSELSCDLSQFGNFFAVQFDDVKHLLRDSKGGEARGFVGARLAPVALKDTQGGLYLVWVEGTNLASSSARPFPFHDAQVADLALVQGELEHGSNLVKA